MDIDCMDVHQGNNCKRFRKVNGYSQEYVAQKMNMTQQEISELERKAIIDDKILEKISLVLNVPIEAIKQITDESVNTFINTFNTYDNAIAIENYNMNPLEKITELYQEKEKLYERMLKTEQEKVKMLESLLKNK